MNFALLDLPGFESTCKDALMIASSVSPCMYQAFDLVIIINQLQAGTAELGAGGL